MDQLIEGMLAVGPRLAPVDRPGVVIHGDAVQRHMLAVALHGELLEIGGKALQILLVGQHGDGLGAEEIVVPDGEQTHQHRQVALERRGAEMLVHFMEAVAAWRGNCPGRWPAWSRDRSPSPSSSARRPNPRSRTCWPCRCRTSPPPRHWSRRRRNVWRWPLRSPFRPASSQSRALCALVMVSSVVKVLEEMMNNVSAGSRSCTASAKSVPSTLETKRKVMARSL